MQDKKKEKEEKPPKFMDKHPNTGGFHNESSPRVHDPLAGYDHSGDM